MLNHPHPPTRAMIRFGLSLLLLASIIIGACTDDAPQIPTAIPPAAVTSLPAAQQTNTAAWWQAFFDPNAPAEYTAGLESWACTPDNLNHWPTGEMTTVLCNDAVAQLSSSFGVFVIGTATPIPGDGAIGLGLVYKNGAQGIEVLYKIVAISTAAYVGTYLGEVIDPSVASSMFSSTGASTQYMDDLYVSISYKKEQHHNQADATAQSIYAAFAAAFSAYTQGGPPPQCKTVITEMVDGATQVALVLMDATIAPGYYPLYWWNENTGAWSAYYKDAAKFDETVRKFNEGKPISNGMNGKHREIHDGCTKLPPGGFATP